MKNHGEIVTKFIPRTTVPICLTDTIPTSLDIHVCPFHYFGNPINYCSYILTACGTYISIGHTQLYFYHKPSNGHLRLSIKHIGHFN